MKKVLLTICFIAVMIAAGAMKMAWEHNPQCEYHCDGVVHWSSLAVIGGTWFLLAAVVMMLAFVPLYWLVNRNKPLKKI